MDAEKKLFVDRIDFVRAGKLIAESLVLQGENPYSWQLRIGTTRIRDPEETQYDWLINFGFGHSWRMHERFTGFGMVDGAAHTLFPNIRLRPQLGVLADMETLKVRAYIGAESSDYEGNFKNVWGGVAHYSLSTRRGIRTEISKDDTIRASMGIVFYW